jgi:glycosyltransferase involved in cell wall biosynthesis
LQRRHPFGRISRQFPGRHDDVVAAGERVAARKNPDAVHQLFDRLRTENPFADLQLVLKVKEREAESDWGAIFADDPHIKILSTPLDTQGVLSLIAACDCFVSLHRAEGFGRGLGEAMALGRLALGTAWSGNLDFMCPENSLLVRSDTIEVRADEYPHGAGQHWADPDLGHAHDLLRPVLADPTRGRAIAERGRRDVLQSHGNRGLGLRIVDRVQAIIAPEVKMPKKKKK